MIILYGMLVLSLFSSHRNKIPLDKQNMTTRSRDENSIIQRPIQTI